MAEEGAHVVELGLDRRAQVCRRQERPDFANKCCRRGAVADPRPNLDGVEKGLGQALDKDAYIQRALTFVVEKSSSSFSSSSDEEEKECLRRKSKSRENLVPFEVFRNNNDKKNAASVGR